MKNQTLASKNDTAKALSVSPRTVDYLVKQGRIPSVRIGSRRLFDLADVIEALKAGSAEPGA